MTKVCKDNRTAQVPKKRSYKSKKIHNQATHVNISTNKFVCICKKSYKSQSAITTHINKKHRRERQKYLKGYYNPRKSAIEELMYKIDPQNNKKQVRIQHIKYDLTHVQLSYLACKTVQSITNHYNKALEAKNLKEDFEVSENDSLREQSLQFGVITESYEQKVLKLAENHKLSKIIDQSKYDQQLQNYKNTRIQVNLIHQVKKAFKIDFAVKLDVSLKIIHAFLKRRTHQTEIQLALRKIWSQVPIIRKILHLYYVKWNFILNEGKERNMRRSQE